MGTGRIIGNNQKPVYIINNTEYPAIGFKIHAGYYPDGTIFFNFTEDDFPDLIKFVEEVKKWRK